MKLNEKTIDMVKTKTKTEYELYRDSIILKKQRFGNRGVNYFSHLFEYNAYFLAYNEIVPTKEDLIMSYDLIDKLNTLEFEVEDVPPVDIQRALDKQPKATFYYFSLSGSIYRGINPLFFVDLEVTKKYINLKILIDKEEELEASIFNEWEDIKSIKWDVQLLEDKLIQGLFGILDRIKKGFKSPSAMSDYIRSIGITSEVYGSIKINEESNKKGK
jgi:hypothetical protein